MTDEAKKYDADKLRFDLIPPDAELALAAVLTYGAAKYGDRNWERGDALDPERVYGALRRHLNARAMGEVHDPETGMPHVWHAHACTAFLVAIESRHSTDWKGAPPTPALQKQKLRATHATTRSAIRRWRRRNP